MPAIARTISPPRMMMVGESGVEDGRKDLTRRHNGHVIA
jgi:hypothetical protein